MNLPTGEQLFLTDGRQEAVVCEVGATLRQYRVEGRPVCWGFDEDQLSTGGRGQVLAPWPNRLEDGSYVHDGRACQAAWNEPERRNAIHGLVRWLAWRTLERSSASVRLECVLHPQPGYRFSVSLEVGYRLVQEGLVVTTTARNLGDTSAPFGLGFHNYLDAGPGRVDRCKIGVPASSHLVVDDRLIPSGSEPVEGSRLAPVIGDARSNPALGELVIDDCFTDLQLGDDDRWTATFVPSGGVDHAVSLWADRSFSWVTLYSGDTLEPGDRRRGLAVEPMTCPANAFRSGDGLVVLEPGTSFSASWGLSPSLLLASVRS